ncbi:MAG: hypothetical protein IPF47_20330 [Gemmatimonadetes bacterium]|nr:hypothetical protein [Gemmatimonadota bacterium]
MTHASDSLAPSRAAGGIGRYFSLPLLLAALLAAFVHTMPYLNAARQTPEGWRFTGYLTGSPDEMQYRMLMQRSLDQGPIVDNPLTTEPHKPHIAVLFCRGVGHIAKALDARPGIVYGVLGSVLAAAIAFLLFWIVDRFSTSRTQTWWVYLALMFGGGFSAHLRWLDTIDRLREIHFFDQIVTQGLANSTIFEAYRNHFIVTTFFDTHFLFFLLMALLAIVALYWTMVKFSIVRMLLTAMMFGLVTVLHIYDGVTLLAIGGGILALFWLRGGQPTKAMLMTLVLSALSVGAAISWQLSLFRNSGLGIPEWRAPAILFSELALAYPLAWGLMAWGLGDYWRKAGLDECFLLGWTVGCVALTLSGPFYPYSDRGALTLQVPIMIIAGAVYFSRYTRVKASHAAFAVFTLVATPAWKLYREFATTSFANHPSGEPSVYIWMAPGHQGGLEGAPREGGARRHPHRSQGQVRVSNGRPVAHDGLPGTLVRRALRAHAQL